MTYMACFCYQANLFDLAEYFPPVCGEKSILFQRSSAYAQRPRCPPVPFQHFAASENNDLSFVGMLYAVKRLPGAAELGKFRRGHFQSCGCIRLIQSDVKAGYVRIVHAVDGDGPCSLIGNRDDNGNSHLFRFFSTMSISFFAVSSVMTVLPASLTAFSTT